MVSFLNERHEILSLIGWCTGPHTVISNISVDYSLNGTIVLQLLRLIQCSLSRYDFTCFKFSKTYELVGMWTLNFGFYIADGNRFEFLVGAIKRFIAVRHAVKISCSQTSVYVEVIPLFSKCVLIPFENWIEWSEEVRFRFLYPLHLLLNLLMVEEKTLTWYFYFLLREFLICHF